MKKILIILASLLALLFLGVMLAPKLIDWNEKIAATVEDATGRKMRIGGDVTLSLFPNVAFSAGDIHLANAPGAKAADMVSVGSVSGKLKLLPLLGRRVVVESLVLTEPSLNLEVDKQGRANWIFQGEKKGSSKPAEEPSGGGDGGGGLPVKDITLNEVSLVGGSFSLNNALTGQVVDGKELNISVGLSDFASPLTLKLALLLNGEPVSFDFSFDTPGKLLEGLPAGMDLSFITKHVTTKYKGSVRTSPVPGLNGAFDLDIPSAGSLAAWLGRPLGDARPDPGPVSVHARFSGEGAKVVLTEATVAGTALKVKASGSYDGSGDIAKVFLDVDSEALDIDRYLPKPGKGAPKAPPGVEKADDGGEKTGPPADLSAALAALSDKPLDLSALRKTEADLRIAVGGIRAMGFKTGRIDLVGNLKGGLLSVKLNTGGLYGGNIDGTVNLDGSGTELSVDTLVKVNAVKVGSLLGAVLGEAPPLKGVASASLTAAARGAAPKSLVESLKGGIDFGLSKVDMKDVPLSEAKLHLELPGIKGSPSLTAGLRYNREEVKLDLTTDPLQKILSGDEFRLNASVDSRFLGLGYDGKLRVAPLPGLGGGLNLHIPSVGKLASWLGSPLDKSQPDPGPLKLTARFSGGEKKATLESATLEGKAVKVNASGSLDAGGKVPMIKASVRVAQANLNAYLPKSDKKGKAPSGKPKPAPQKKPGTAPSGWSEDPLDLTPLSKVNADLQLTIDSLDYREIKVTGGSVKVLLKGGVLESSVEKLRVAGGIIESKVSLDGSGRAAGLDYRLAVSELAARPFLASLAGSGVLSGSTTLEAKGTARGVNQKELVGSLNGDGHFKFIDGAVHGINIPATLRKAGSLGLDNEAAKELKTDFAELSGSFVIRKGVLENRDFKMLAPLVRLSGDGTVPMPARSVDYDLTAKLVASLQGQGAKDSLAGVPIPVNINGSWEKPSVNVNWKSVFGILSSDPESLKNLPGSLRDVGKGLGFQLPIPAASGKGSAPGEKKELTPLDILQGLAPKSQTTPSEQGGEAAEKKDDKPDPASLLRGFFD